ncbi:MAG: oxidoreductase [Acidobacteria bacterium]|nr:MAG: oxidoreductase [Acidobacteriota bacterium]
MTRIQDYDVSDPIQGKVVSTERLTPDNSKVEIRDIVLQLNKSDFAFKIGQSIGVIAPGKEKHGTKHHFRLYTVAGEDPAKNTIRLCVKRCFYIDDFNGERYEGIASNYLCNLKEGEEISLAGPFGIPFKLPEEKAADILMIGMGTGIAPFRAFVRDLYEKEGGWNGQVRLFYGAKTGMELAYMNDQKNDFEHYYDKKTFKAFEAVSPKPLFNAPVAMTEALEKNSEEIWNMLLNRKVHVYVAGLESIKNMLSKAFVKIAGNQRTWESKYRELNKSGRWQELIY